MIRALMLSLALAMAAPIAPALAQPRAQAAQTQHGVPVERVVSPGGVEAWLVSDDTVPMIVVRAYWEGGSAIEPERVIGVTGVMTDMLTEGSGDLDANAFKERMQDLNMSLGFGAGWDGIGMSLTTLSEHRDEGLRHGAAGAPRRAGTPRRWSASAASCRSACARAKPISLAAPWMTRSIRPSVRAPHHGGDGGGDRSGGDGRAHAHAAGARPHDDHGGGRHRRGHAGAAAGRDVRRAAAQPGAAGGDAGGRLRTPTPLIVRELPQPRGYVVFAAPGIQDEDPDWIPLAVANYILGGGGFSSRLMDQVREQRGLVYGIGTGPSVRDHSALIRGTAQTENGDVRERSR
ncbi:MAG: insulinase family protein [Hyphomonadaceae bacterium]